MQPLARSPRSNRKLFKFAVEKPYSDWTEEEKKVARDVSGGFHLVGVLAEEGLVSGDLMSRIFYYSLPTAHNALREYLTAIRKERGKSYWGGFDLLAQRAKKNGPYLDPTDPRLTNQS
jgi:hypothetical protein